MKTFQFRLQTLLRLRIATRDQRRAELAEALQAEAILSERIAEIDSQMRQNQDATRSLQQPGGVNVDTLAETRRYQFVLSMQIEAARRQQDQVRQETERRRQVLVEAERELQTLEKLRETQYEAYRFQNEQEETKRLDELASSRFQHRKVEP